MTSGVREVRMISAASSPASPHPSPATRHYQLTHDYLVHSLRDWLTRKQRETRRGRAALRLAERAATLEGEARESAPALALGMGNHPAADKEEKLDRARAPDDEAGGAASRSAGSGSGVTWSPS